MMDLESFAESCLVPSGHVNTKERSAGYFYVMLVAPDLSANRVKLGFARRVRKRKRNFTTISPTVKIIKVWPCLQENEQSIIHHVTRSGCTKIGREVFDVESVDTLVKSIDDVFSGVHPLTKHRSPSRDNYAYCYIPKDLAERLTAHGKRKERSFSFMVKKACEAALKHLDAEAANEP